MKNIILPLIATLLLASCAEVKESKDVKSDEIYQRFTCDYKSDGSGTFKAEFLTGAEWDRLEEEKHSDSYVDFGEKSPVTCNGINMKREEGSLSGVYYICDIPAGTKEITVVWTDKDGKKYTNKAPLYPFELIPDQKMERRVGDGWKILWKGEPSNADSRVEVTIRGDERNARSDSKSSNDRTSSEFAQNPGDNFVLFSEQTLYNFNGSYKVTAKRKSIIRLQETTKAEGTLKLTGDGGKFETSSGILF